MSPVVMPKVGRKSLAEKWSTGSREQQRTAGDVLNKISNIIYLQMSETFQADDEGSIPFTRSIVFFRERAAVGRVDDLWIAVHRWPRVPLRRPKITSDFPEPPA